MSMPEVAVLALKMAVEMLEVAVLLWKEAEVVSGSPHRVQVVGAAEVEIVGRPHSRSVSETTIAFATMTVYSAHSCA